MHAPDDRSPFQIRDGARHFEHPVQSPGRQPERVRRLVQKTPTGRVGP